MALSISWSRMLAVIKKNRSNQCNDNSIVLCLHSSYRMNKVWVTSLYCKIMNNFIVFTVPKENFVPNNYGTRFFFVNDIAGPQRPQLSVMKFTNLLGQSMANVPRRLMIVGTMFKIITQIMFPSEMSFKIVYFTY
jgi:hypothetical protein